MAVLSRSYGYLFIQAPRTGCTAIAEGVLRPRLEGVDIPPEDVYDHHGNLVMMQKHCRLSDLLRHGYLGPEEAGRLLKFSAVRNPFDSLVSLYVKMRTEHAALLEDPTSWVGKDPAFASAVRFASEHSFPEWIEYRYRRTRPRSVLRDLRRRVRRSPGGHDRGMDFVMRFERLQEDFDEVLRRLGIEAIEIPRINPTASRDRDYRSHYTPRARRIVAEAFADRLERYGYRF